MPPLVSRVSPDADPTQFLDMIVCELSDGQLVYVVVVRDGVVSRIYRLDQT